ncbi:MAG: hypothetical protein Q8N60_03755, partial [Candidatus Diapherotrites archaeon]|nr:hypothetical protein [Candidatus Diapherotrites archaeon]
MSRGQASVELLLVALIVLAGSIAIASYYININDSVTATALLKVKVLEKTSGLSYFAYIEKIEPKVSGSTIDFYLSAEPATKVTCGELGLIESGEGIIKDLIMDKTNF